MEFEESTEKIFHQKESAHRKLLLLSVLAIGVGLGVGIIIGRYALCKKTDQSTQSTLEYLVEEADSNVGQKILNEISNDNIRNYLKDLSELPHLAGTDADYRQAKALEKFWKQEGLDEIFMTPYDVLLSYPNTTDEDEMNRIFVRNEAGDIQWQSALREPVLFPSENKSNVVPPFNAYSAPGDIESSGLVYVNYGRVEDFNWIVNNASINVTNRIVLARYGAIFRGDKVRQAERFGAKGIILFSDPADVTDLNSTKVYPDDWWLPDTGTQRGTTKIGKGDPLTPGYPATEVAYRLDESNLRQQGKLPSIPVHPIGYGVAKTLLSYMSGNEVPNSWKGGINVTYRVGGPLANPGWTVRMKISTKNVMKRTYNVIGILKGRIEPDRYVLLGNHRDAWVFGAIDPSSGTAVMKEISRVMGNMAKNKRWRPRRSIVFCSWGSEEYGLIGSTEWVEQYIKTLASRSVAYINVDIAVAGNYTLLPAATPLMYQTIIEATKKVPNPDENDVSSGVNTVYDKMLKVMPDKNNKSRPSIRALGASSDYASFVQQIGLPCADIWYFHDTKKWKISLYPLYHTKYETFHAVDKIMDIGFKFHQAVARTSAEMLRNLADSLIIPFNVNDYAKEMKKLVNQFDKDYGDKMRNKSIKMEYLNKAYSEFERTVSTFDQIIRSVDKTNPFAIRQINDQLLQLDRAFIDPNGLPGRPTARHLLFAESSVDSYSGSSFPGLVDSLFEIEGSENEDERWETVKKHFATVVHTINSASYTLRDVTKFMPEFQRPSQ